MTEQRKIQTYQDSRTGALRRSRSHPGATYKLLTQKEVKDLEGGQAEDTTEGGAQGPQDQADRGNAGEIHKVP